MAPRKDALRSYTRDVQRIFRQIFDSPLDTVFEIQYGDTAHILLCSNHISHTARWAKHQKQTLTDVEKLELHSASNLGFAKVLKQHVKAKGGGVSKYFLMNQDNL